jgi:hypothetical protein
MEKRPSDRSATVATMAAIRSVTLEVPDASDVVLLHGSQRSLAGRPEPGIDQSGSADPSRPEQNPPLASVGAVGRSGPERTHLRG